jgi:bifunctional non-homologous end joining protein LigD
MPQLPNSKPRPDVTSTSGARPIRTSRPTDGAVADRRRGKRRRPGPYCPHVAAARRRPPGFIEPCIPTVAAKPPTGPQWLHEIKHDGYRLIARKTAGRVRLFTRRGYDWTDRYPRIVEAVAALLAGSATIDGEAVYCDATGLSIFDALHSRRHDDRVLLYAFDLLEVDGADFRPQPLHARKARLEKLLARAPAGIQYNEHVEGDGAVVFAHACKLGLEGIISKHREHPYRSGRSRSWLKVKNPAAPGVTRFEPDA